MNLLRLFAAALTVMLLAPPAHALRDCRVMMYSTQAALEAANVVDCTIAYALDTDVLELRAGGAWVGLSPTTASLTGANGGTWANGTNNVWTLIENSEDWTFTFGSNSLTMDSSTGTLLTITPATTVSGDLTLGGGAGALTFGAGSSSIVTTDNSATGLLVGSTGTLSLLTFDTRDAAEGLINAGYLTVGTTLGVTGVATLSAGAGALTFSNTAASVVVGDNDTTALDIGSTGLTSGIRYSSEDNKEIVTFSTGVANAVVAVTTNITLDNSDCGKHLQVTAAFDGSTITLPATIAGCVYNFEYIGAAAGALVDVSPNASDGIYGPSGSAGWVVAAGANTACSTTCGASACLGGIDTGTTIAVNCASALADTCYCEPVGLSGTDDADVGITKATIRKGDSFSIVGDGTDGWFVFKQSTRLANN